MAEQCVLEAETRVGRGKAAVRRLRRKANRVPGVVYGGGEDTVLVEVELRLLAKAMEQQAFFSQIIQLQIDGEPEQAVLRDLQRHPANERVLHVDFMRVQADKPIQISVPLQFLNEDNCIGVRQSGGNISHNLIEVEIMCLPAALPASIDVDVEDLDLGQALHLSDLELPEGVTIMALASSDEHDIPVVSVQAPRGGLEEEEEALEDELLEGEEETPGEAEDSAAADEDDASSDQ
ncbi:MAG: 50S ribosomal protein L25/general stress protein Ctc [Gammaproteobacteria bacterium]|nr:50S ribosomal protein L25/general stress protein Ctc [Gammaproteobacteria bacterium]